MAKKKVSRAKSKQNEPQGEELTFEEGLASLETIVARLESGELGLGESLEAYEAGIGQLKACHRLLAAAERRIEVLSGMDADGNPILEPVEQLGEDERTSEASRPPHHGSNAEELF